MGITYARYLHFNANGNTTSRNAINLENSNNLLGSEKNQEKNVLRS